MRHRDNNFKDILKDLNRIIFGSISYQFKKIRMVEPLRIGKFGSGARLSISIDSSKLGWSWIKCGCMMSPKPS